jgi:hypothetical protein
MSSRSRLSFRDDDNRTSLLTFEFTEKAEAFFNRGPEKETLKGRLSTVDILIQLPSIVS